MKNLIWSLLFNCMALHSIAQTTIDNITEGSYLQLGAIVNSRTVFAGQSLGIKGLELLPAIAYHHKSGLYGGIGSSTYTDSSIIKKAPIAEVNYTLGYQNDGDVYSIDASVTHSQVLYGNKFFRSYLANAVSVENKFNLSENVELNANIMHLFGAKYKRNNATVLEANVQYHFIAEDFLGAEQLTVTPIVQYYFGSDKLAATFSARDSISSNNKKVNVSNAMHTLSAQGGIEINWQKNMHELELSIYFPYARTYSYSGIGAQAVESAKLQGNAPYISFGYNIYLGKGNDN
jgi:hypothetical protein